MTLLRYPADSAGSVMTPEFVSLRPGDTVRQALDTIRRTGIHKETVYTCYVLEHRQLLGVVSAKDLLTAAEDAAVADLMVTDVVSVGTLTDREEAPGSWRNMTCWPCRCWMERSGWWASSPWMMPWMS